MRRSRLFLKSGVVFLSFVFCLVFTGLGGAQEKFPSREITFITGLQAGASTDMVWRPFLTATGKILGQPIVVLNRPGGAHAVAMNLIKNAKPDGYTIGGVPSAAASAQLMLKSTTYDVLKDFTYIMQTHGYRHGIVVKADAPWKTIQELIEYVKNNPGKVRLGVVGAGAGQHISAERLSDKLGIKFNIIPLVSAVACVTNVLGGHVEAIYAPTTWLPNVEAGDLRLLAVSGSDEGRMPEFPNVPSLMELYGIGLPGFSSVAAPKGVPPERIDILHKALKQAMNNPEFIATAKKFAVPIVYRGPEELTKYVKEFMEMTSDNLNRLGLLPKR